MKTGLSVICQQIVKKVEINPKAHKTKMSKRYGLILPGKKEEPVQPKADFSRPSVFGSESDSDDNAPPTKSSTSRVSMGPGNAEKRQARRVQEKALKEDPTVFQYDEVYDEMETKRDEEKKAKTAEIKKPRYINRLLECAERRKIEYERRIERLAQKEREAEGDQFKDKESFVTSAYRKKLEELKKAEEREKREDYLEAIGDVTKQQDLGGFYRHLYEQKLGPKTAEHPTDTDKSPQKELEKIDKIKGKKARAYRKRRASEEDEDEPPPQKNDGQAKKAHLQSNLDADSDFSIDSSSDSEVENSQQKENSEVTQANGAEEIAVKQEPVSSPEVSKTTEATQNDVSVKKEDIKVEKDDNANEEKNIEKKPKKDIWKKRTVGEVFEAALQRYHERKAARNG